MCKMSGNRDTCTQTCPANIQMIKLIFMGIITAEYTARDVLTQARTGVKDFEVFSSFSISIIKNHLKACRQYCSTNHADVKLSMSGGKLNLRNNYILLFHAELNK